MALSFRAAWGAVAPLNFWESYSLGLTVFFGDGNLFTHSVLYREVFSPDMRVSVLQQGATEPYSVPERDGGR